MDEFGIAWVDELSDALLGRRELAANDSARPLITWSGIKEGDCVGLIGPSVYSEERRPPVGER